MTLGVVLVISAANCLAITSDKEMKDYLVKNSIFSKDDISKLESGEMIARLLPNDDKRGVEVCGIISVNASPDTGLKAFYDTMSRENKASILALGKFSESPSIEDLQSLTLDKHEIEGIKQCRVGNCGMRFSAEMIERFQKEIDWNSADYSQQVNSLFKEMILDYVKSYLLKGDSALIEY